MMDKPRPSVFGRVVMPPHFPMISRILLPALLLAAALPIPLPAAREVNATAAIVNGGVVTESEIRLLLGGAEAMLRSEYQGETLKKKLAEAREKVLQDLIDREVLLTEFNRMGGQIKEQVVDDEINRVIRLEYKGDEKKFNAYLARMGVTNRKFRELTRKRLIVSVMRSQVTRNVGPSTPEEVRAEYNKMVAKMRDQTGRVKMSKIFIPRVSETGTPAQQQELAKEIRTKLTQGADFASLARQYSRDAMASSGGSWDVMDRKFLKKEIGDAAFATPVGGLSPVVEDETGFHIIKVEAKEGGKVPSFEELRDQATRMVEVSKRAELYEKYISELRKKAVIRKF